jgi:hypothetical protein
VKTVTECRSALSYRDFAIMAVSAAVLVWQAAVGRGVTVQAAEQNPKPAIPEELRVNGPQLAIVHATGFQVYTCVADSRGKLAWSLKAPDATFKNAAGLKGKHNGGPTWEANDGSKVIGDKSKLKSCPSLDANSVPWLLLPAKSHEGTGQLSSVTFIQRIDTSGGMPPAVGGAEAHVPYAADYIFYGSGATTSAANP